MSNKSDDVKKVHERTALGEEPASPNRRSGMMLARPGHYMAVAPIIPESKAKPTSTKSKRAVRLKISLPKTRKED